ncbi:MAG: hypothetical protein ACMXYM_04885 [Candidatus Woesearchaeota archaeon]
MARTKETAKTRSAAKEKTPKARSEREKKDDDPEALFIPAGVLTGMGFGFLFGNIVAGLFLGLGFGFLVFAFLAVMKRSR